MGLSTADILSLPDSPQKSAMLAQLQAPTPNPTPVALRKAAHTKGVMNKTEEAYATHLQHRQDRGEIEWWGFEVRTLRLDDRTTYTPDFWVVLPGGAHEFHEVKGRHTWEDSVIKFKWAADRYDYARFVMVKKGKEGAWNVCRQIPAPGRKLPAAEARAFVNEQHGEAFAALARVPAKGAK